MRRPDADVQEDDCPERLDPSLSFLYNRSEHDALNISAFSFSTASRADVGGQSMTFVSLSVHTSGDLMSQKRDDARLRHLCTLLRTQVLNNVFSTELTV